VSLLKAISNVLYLDLCLSLLSSLAKIAYGLSALLHYHELLFLMDSSHKAGLCCRSALIDVYVHAEQLVCHESNLTRVTSIHSCS